MRYFCIGLGELTAGMVVGGGVALFLTWLELWQFQIAAGLAMTLAVLAFHEWRARKIAANTIIRK
jgi:hypothetical protein